MRAVLDSGLAALGLELGDTASDTLIAYVALLAKWNETYNLTAVREPLAMVTRHILDSASVLPFISGDRLLDIGTGAGLPGLVIAISRPEIHCVLLDSNAKKTRFVSQAVLELGLKNVEVIQERANQYRPVAPFDTVVTRALGKLVMTWRLAWPLLAEGGRLLAMAGKRPDTELRDFEMEFDGLPDVEVVGLSVPGLDADRHLVVVSAI